MDQSWFYIERPLCCWCWLNSLSMCFWIMFVFPFVAFLLLLHVSLLDSSQQVFLTCDFYAVHALEVCTSFFWKLCCGEVYVSGPAFSRRCRLLVTLTSSVSPVVSCTHQEQTGSMCLLVRKRKLTFTVLMWARKKTKPIFYNMPFERWF